MTTTEIWPDADALAQAIADRVVARLADVQRQGRTPSIVLTGGTIAIAAYERITAGDVDWTAVARSEERRVGKECAIVCRSRWSPYH